MEVPMAILRHKPTPKHGFLPKMVCICRCVKVVLGATPGKQHIERHHVPHPARKSWVRSRLTRLVWWQIIFLAWKRQTTFFKAKLNCHRKIPKFGWEVLPHPPYSLDLALSDYHLFCRLSNYLRGKNFKNEEA